METDAALARAIDEFVESRSRENTRVAYRKGVDNYLTSLGLRTFEGFLAVEASDVVKYRNGLQRLGRSPSTVNQRLAAVRRPFRPLLRLGPLPRHPPHPHPVAGLPLS